ncbi:MAG: PHP domain-containing protein [Propionibacteriaceae bacterium]|jgi:predicted metal-dependent phosphoesterase TrpH|nr:PHP domain-containing protein [Propionibacteriaceae bacterium]
MSGEYDLHTHSAVSDGTDRPAELVRKAKRLGLKAIAICDHDTFGGLAEARTAAAAVGIKFLAGVEITTDLGASVHLLGYGCDSENQTLNKLLAANRQAKDDRTPRILAKLAELGMPLSMEDVRKWAPEHAAIQRPHIADAMVAAGYVVNRDEAFAKYISETGPAYVPSVGAELPLAVRAVREAGGVPVIAHPWSRGSREVLDEGAIAWLADLGLLGIEADHPDHSAEDREGLRKIAKHLDLLVTGSSDHHGKGKTRNPLGACSTAPEVFEEIVDMAARP